VGSWLYVTVEFKGLFLSDFFRDWVTSISSSPPPSQFRKDDCWKPPPQGSLKLNFDGASKGNPGPVGYECVVHNHEGILHKILSGPLAIWDSTMAKTQSMLKGLKELKNMGVSDYIIEGDLEVVISGERARIVNHGACGVLYMKLWTSPQS